MIPVRDPRSGVFDHNFPNPKHSIVSVSVRFMVAKPVPTKRREAIKATAIMFDHNRRKHQIRLAFKGPGMP